jgi:hypothetical protein
VFYFLERKEESMPVTGLENFKLTGGSFRRLGKAKVWADVSLRTYDLTRGVRKLPPRLRHDYLIARVNRWIASLCRSFSEMLIETSHGKLLGDIRRKSDLPNSLRVSGPARMILAVAGARGVRTVHVVRVTGLRRQSSRVPSLSWYCVRAFVAIRVEGATSGLQNTEDRFVLIRASSFEDAKKRLSRKWREYATPYLNSDGQLVSWSLDEIVDIYDIGEDEIDPGGTEVYSKLGRRRMRPTYVWRPESR